MKATVSVCTGALDGGGGLSLLLVNLKKKHICNQLFSLTGEVKIPSL